MFIFWNKNIKNAGAKRKNLKKTALARSKGETAMAKKFKKCQADGCGKFLNSYNKIGFCSLHIDGPAKKIFVAFTKGRRSEACLCWWGDKESILKDYRSCIEITVTGRHYFYLKKMAALLDRLEPVLGSTFLSVDIPDMLLRAFKRNPQKI
ncbi:MAG: hypothetical protein A2Y98_03710 [Candidatus Portnoybacteria bacterium RBG_19FT_COMBO_36_7]|uniref:Uncharacterized protein n=1 Tax=Candidatus Portnoybacteria bacterium RBG_19FT_COMBO_36_7 TaxID=1801992 RepID=A0A1G2F706_9BACT|nr:MAG: hypothetical protein A2Y98_03710 [Candidatus Portnoybacteria bacterium RBG_19FT_COMBO_36_7]